MQRSFEIAFLPPVLARRVRHFGVLVFACFAVSMLGGCSALRLGYTQADKLAYFWLDRYIDFDDAQAQRAREAISAWFTWHRRTQLNDYADTLLKIDAEVPADTTPERACTWWSTIRTKIDRSVEQAVPAIAESAVTLKPAQLANIEARYAKTNKEFRDDFMQSDAAKRHSEAAKRAISRYESFYGDLEQLQRERVELRVSESPFEPRLSLTERQRRQQDALLTLRKVTREPMTPAAAQAEIRGWIQRFDSPANQPQAQYAQRVVQHNCRVLAELHNSTTPGQRQAASKRIRGWAADLRSLAADSGE